MAEVGAQGDSYSHRVDNLCRDDMETAPIAKLPREFYTRP